MFWDCRGWGSGRVVRIFFLMLLVAIALPGIAAPATVELVSQSPLWRAPDTSGSHSWTNESYRGESAISADGRYVAFNSTAANLVPGQVDRNNAPDIFLYDRVAGTLTLVSHAAGSALTACDEGASGPVLSRDGRFLVFSSIARDLVPLGESLAGNYQVFLFEIATRAVTLVSRRAGSAEAANGSSMEPRISADGSVIAYLSSSTDLLPDTVSAGRNVYVYERATGVTKLAASPDIWVFDLSANGRFVAFVSSAAGIVPGQIDPGYDSDVFLWDRITGAATLVSHAVSSSTQAGHGESSQPSLSADGGLLAFSSEATDLVSGVTDTNQKPDVFLYDRLTGSVSLVSRSLAAAGSTAPGGAFQPRISADGNAVAFYRSDPDEAEQGFHALVFDRLAGTVELVTRSARSASRPANQGAEDPSLVLSANGRYVAFSSTATNLVPGQSDASPYSRDVFFLDRVTGSRTLVSHGAGFPARTGKGSSMDPVLSADGRWVAFCSYAGDLVADVRDSTDSTRDVFLWERDTASPRVLSFHPPGMPSRSLAGRSFEPAVSGDGRFVAFTSVVEGLVPGFEDTNASSDVFLYDKTTRKTLLLSRSRGGRASANNGSGNPRISRDGNWILYESLATDLVRGQKDGRFTTSDVFLYDRIGQQTLLVSRSSLSPTRTARGQSVPRGLSADGSVVVFESTATDLIPGQEDRNNVEDLFLWDRRSGAVTLISRTPESPVRTGHRGVFFSSMSPDGNFVAFTSAASDLVPDDDADLLQDAYLWDRRTGKVEALHPVPGESSRNPIVSADGRYAAFAVTTSQDVEHESEEVFVPHGVYLLDRKTGRLRQVAAPSQLGWTLGLSGNGRHLLFQSSAGSRSLVDLYLFDRASGKTRLVSSTATFAVDTARTLEAHLGADGRHVAFLSRSPDFGPKWFDNVVLYDRTTGESTLISRSRLVPSQGGNGTCQNLALSATGGFVAFTSEASDLVPRDFNGDGDVFLYSPGDLP